MNPGFLSVETITKTAWEWGPWGRKSPQPPCPRLSLSLHPSLPPSPPPSPAYLIPNSPSTEASASPPLKKKKQPLSYSHLILVLRRNGNFMVTQSKRPISPTPSAGQNLDQEAVWPGELCWLKRQFAVIQVSSRWLVHDRNAWYFAYFRNKTFKDQSSWLLGGGDAVS